MFEQINEWIASNQLVRLTVVYKKKERKTIFGRIIQLNQEQQDLLVYDDDHKIIHHIHYTEIDDIQPS